MNPKKQFDVVIMNPPYQAPKEKTKDVTGMSGAKLWTEFCKIGLILLKEDGFACMIHPGGWRKPNSEIFQLFKDKDLQYLEMHNLKDGTKMFKVSTGYDWYILKNSANSGYTVVKDMNGVETIIDLRDWAFIPNSEFALIDSLMAKGGQERCEVLFNRTTYGSDKKWMNEVKTEKFKYPCVYGLTQKDGLKLWYSSERNGHFGIPKVIVPLSKYTDTFFDADGEYGMCQFTFGIQVSSKGREQIATVLKSDAFRKVWDSVEWIYNGKEWRVFKYFRRDFWKEFL